MPNDHLITDRGQTKIMQVVPALNVGGVERGTVEFAYYLKQAGYETVVVSAGGALAEDLEKAGIRHIELNVNKKSLSSLLSVKKLRMLMQELEIDVVHARSRIPAWLCHLALKKMAAGKPKLVTTLHGLHSVSKYSAIMARGDQVIAVSETARNYLIDHFGAYLKQDPIVISRGIGAQFVFGYQPNAVWQRDLLEQFPKLESGKKILMPGRLTRVKGIENLIPWLRSTDKENRLLLTASKDESKYSRKIVTLMKHNGVDEKLIWLGVQRNMPDLYALADLVVSVNNKPESFGRTVLEALSIGTPVVAFASGGVSEIMHNLYPAGAVSYGSTSELADRIELFLDNPPAVQAHQQYKNQTMFEQTLAVYNELLHGS